MAGLLNPYQATPLQRAKKINAKWNGNTLTDAQGNIVMQAPGLLYAAEKINQFLPVTGDIQAGLLAANDVKQGNYDSAALNSLGLLPFVPAMGGVTSIKSLANKAKSTYPKLSVDDVFLKSRGTMPDDLNSKLNTVSDFSILPNRDVNLSDIVPTQKNINLENLKKISKVNKFKDDVILAKQGNQYYVVDGHHRIANQIINDGKNINAKVYE